MGNFDEQPWGVPTSGVSPEYLHNWVRTSDGYEHAPRPAIHHPSTDSDRLLTVIEVATELGLPAHLIRGWDRDGILVPAQRSAHGNRMYTRSQLTAPAIVDRAAAERANRQQPSTTHGLITVAEGADLLGITPRALRSAVSRNEIQAAGTTPGGRLLFRRTDIDTFVTLAPDLSSIGETAAACGIPVCTPRALADSNQVPSIRTPFSGRRRFNVADVKAALARLGANASASDRLVGIGAIARHTNLTTGIIRTMADRGEIPVACRIGGKRRFHLNTTVAAVTTRRATKRAR